MKISLSSALRSASTAATESPGKCKFPAAGDMMGLGRKCKCSVMLIVSRIFLLGLLAPVAHGALYNGTVPGYTDLSWSGSWGNFNIGGTFGQYDVLADLRQAAGTYQVLSVSSNGPAANTTTFSRTRTLTNPSSFEQVPVTISWTGALTGVSAGPTPVAPFFLDGPNLVYDSGTSTWIGSPKGVRLSGTYTISTANETVVGSYSLDYTNPVPISFEGVIGLSNYPDDLRLGVQYNVDRFGISYLYGGATPFVFEETIAGIDVELEAPSGLFTRIGYRNQGGGTLSLVPESSAVSLVGISAILMVMRRRRIHP